MSSVEVIKRDLKGMLSEYRYLHCLRVAELSRELAHIYHVDVYKAYLAGLVHDIAKEFSVDDNKNIIYKYNLPIELLNRDYSKIYILILVHVLLGINMSLVKIFVMLF